MTTATANASDYDPALDTGFFGHPRGLMSCFATEMWEQVDQDLMEIGAAERPGQAMEEFSSEILKGRVAKPEDITGTTTFLASKDSDYMTGQIVMIDGGMTLV